MLEERQHRHARAVGSKLDAGLKDTLLTTGDVRQSAAVLPSSSLTNIFDEKLIAIVAEPGMGKTFLATIARRRAESLLMRVYSYQLDDLSGEQACGKIVRCSREVCKRLKRNRGTLVIFDGIAPGDEIDAATEARAIERLVNAGAQAIVCVRPESEQVVECLVGAIRLDAEDLIVRLRHGEDELWELTGGIPWLVSAHMAPSWTRDGLADPMNRRYLDALEGMLANVVRPELPLEEQRVRLAMVLLGHGSMEEVAMVAGRCDVEQLQWLERDVPLLGIDARNRTFTCCGIYIDEVFGACESALRSHAAEHPQLIVRACGALAAREDMHRSVIASRLCLSEDDHASICMAWGVSYAAIGEAKVVEDALRRAEAMGMAKGPRYRLDMAALSALSGTAAQMDEQWNQLKGLRVTTSVEARLYRRVLLLGACRDTLRSPQTIPTVLETDAGDSIGLACLDHLTLMRLLINGRFEEAYALATNDTLAREPISIPEALVCDDVMASLILCGGAPDLKEKRLFKCAGELFERSSLRRLHSYHLALVAAVRVLMGSDTETSAIEEAASRAERAGDNYVHAFCLFACAVADLRMRAYSRAHVRAQKAEQTAQVLCVGYLLASTQLVDAIAQEFLGESGSLAHFCSLPGIPEGMALIARVAASATQGTKVRAVDIPSAMPLPRDILWVLNVFSNDCPELWTGMVGSIPVTWFELLRAVRQRQVEALEGRAEEPIAPSQLDAHVQPATLGEGGQTDLLPPRDDARVRITILGGFTIEFDGEPLPEGALERRRARDLVILLAIAPGHKMRRYQAIEVLWGGDDYYKGPRKLYEATGEARKRLAKACDGENYIIADRTQGSIGLDMGLVSCDVDDFEREARMTLSEDGDDFWVLDHARNMMRLYATGPNEHLAALGPLVADRVDELQTLYIDGTIAAGEAALRLGKAKLAVRYALDAHRADDLREDAMILLVRALKASGRAYEVADYYKRYSRHLIEVRGVPPSLALRRIVEITLQDESGGFLT